MSEPYFSDGNVTLYHGDCLTETAWLDADVLITDPPYGIAYNSGRPRQTVAASIAGDEDTSVRERFLGKTSIDLANGCVEWTGGLDPYGYGKFHLCRDGRKHKILAHRIAYALANGPYDPRMQVDHVCLNRRCVSPEHLRLATHAQQQQHRAGAHRTSRSGVRGVSWCAQTGRRIGQVNVAGRRIHVGYFDSITEAEAAVVAARLQHMTHSDPELRQEKIA